MNRHIKRLAKQAEDRMLGYSYFDREKFAESIIQECMDIIAPYMLRKYADGRVEMHDPGRPLHHPIMEIKEHFGMK
jgi:hypothetical protein